MLYYIFVLKAAPWWPIMKVKTLYQEVKVQPPRSGQLFLHSERPSRGRNGVVQVNRRKSGHGPVCLPSYCSQKLTRQSGTHNSSLALQPACRSGNCCGSPRRQHRPSAVFVAIFTRLISSDVVGSVSLQLASPGASASSGGKFYERRRTECPGAAAGASSQTFRDPQIRTMMMG